MADDVVYENRLDKRYLLKVVRTSAYAGRFTLTDSETGKELHAEDTGLAYGAEFGPDVADVHRWQELAVKVVDGDG